MKDRRGGSRRERGDHGLALLRYLGEDSDRMLDIEIDGTHMYSLRVVREGDRVFLQVENVNPALGERVVDSPFFRNSDRCSYHIGGIYRFDITQE